MTDQQPTNGSGLSGADMLALVAHITGLLGEMEGRIMARLTENATGAEDRWRKHDAASERTVAAIREEISILRADFTAHLKLANAHFAKEHDEELVIEARVKPVKTAASYMATHWRNILIILLALLSIIGWSITEVRLGP